MPSRAPQAWDTKAAGKQVLTNEPWSLAGAISPTAVSERSLGCGAGLDHRVLGGHRIKQRRGIENAAAPPQQPRRPRRGVDIIEQPPRPIRLSQPVTHPDQYRGVKGP